MTDQEIDRLRREVEILHHITDTVWSVLDLKQVLASIVEVVSSYSNADSCLIYLYDERKKKLVLSASSRTDADSDRSIELDLNEGLTGWAAARQQPVVIDEKSYDDPRFKLIKGLEEDSYEAFLSVPMIFKGKLVGVINVMHRDRYQHSETEVRLIENIARQVAGAVENARIYEELREKNRRLEALYTVSQSLVSDNYLEDMLNLIVSVTGEMFNSRICSLMLLDEAKNELQIKAVHGLSVHYREKSPLRISDSAVGQVVINRKPLQIYDVTADERYRNRDVARKEGLKSLLSVPLVVKGKPIGVLNLYTAFPHVFSVEETRAVQALANQAAVAINNYYLKAERDLLEKELEERKVVEKAKGVLMEMYGMTEDEAFRFLRKQSMNLRKSMKEVAEAVLVFKDLKKNG